MAVRKEKEYMFVCDSIAQRSFQYFADMRQKKEFCDVTFQLENQDTIFAHRVILTAAIPYFRGVLTTSNQCQDQEAGTDIPEIDSGAFKCLIEFAYNHRMQINVNNVWDILGGACCLGVEEVRGACRDFIADTLEIENALHARQQANTLNCSELVKDIDCYVAENFAEISRTRAFLDCSADYVKELLSRDDLYVDNEDQVLDAILRWAKSSPGEKSVVLPEMMCKVRMLHVKPEYLAKLTVTEDIVRASMLCRDLVDEARNYSLFPEIRKDVCSFVTEPRKIIKISDDENNQYICRMSAKQEYMVEYYDLIEGQWHAKERTRVFHTAGSFAKVQNKMYFFRWGDTVQYDPETNKYVFLCNKPTPLTSIAVATFQNKIYLFGGYGCLTASNAVECFDPEKDQWTRMKPMRTGRFGVSAVRFGNYIYVMGGADQSAVYDYIERYDPAKDQWRAMSSLLIKRCYASASTLNGNIYICGGSTLNSARSVTGSVEIYDPVKNLSKFVEHLSVPRWQFVVLSHCGKLYALGGEDSNEEDIDSFDIYDSKNDFKWVIGPFIDSADLTTGAVMSSDMGS